MLKNNIETLTTEC